MFAKRKLDVDSKGLIERAQAVKVKESNLIWVDWERYSNRQEEKMKMGGFTGSAAFGGDFEEFSQLILIGEQIHVGKGTSFGLGKYEILYE